MAAGKSKPGLFNLLKQQDVKKVDDAINDYLDFYDGKESEKKKVKKGFSKDHVNKYYDLVTDFF